MMMMVVEGLKKEVVRRVVEEDEQKRENGRRGEECMGICWVEREKEQKIRREKKRNKKKFQKIKKRISQLSTEKKKNWVQPTLKQHVSTRDKIQNKAWKTIH